MRQVRIGLELQVVPGRLPSLGNACLRTPDCSNFGQRPVSGERLQAALGCFRTLRRATIASTLLEYLVPHSQRGASAFPKVLPKAVREYSTFGGISPKSTRSMIPSACSSLSCWISTLSLTLPTARLNSP